jgi:murein L,D-transpeptidase YcbB/YkuD
MKRSVLPLAFLLPVLLIIVLSFGSCDIIKKKSDVDSVFVRQVIVGAVSERHSSAPKDSALLKYYSGGNKLIWLSADGKQKRICFVNYLMRLKEHGVNPQLLGLNNINSAMNDWKNSDHKSGNHRNLLAARLEYLLSKAFLAYINGMYYGFVSPAPIYNNLYENLGAYPDSVTPPADRKKKMFRLFVSPLKRPSVRFDEAMLGGASNNLQQTLKDAQPRTLYYTKLQDELRRTRHNKHKRTCLIVNLERARWKYRQPMGNKYVYVNTAAFMLKAVDTVRDTLFEMKICCGSFEHKSPILTSQLTYFELNPSWRIPPKIVKREMIPKFLRDSSYFYRNNIRVFDKTGRQLDSRRINWSKYLKSGIPFKMIQDSGESSDLGRIIFRFPNPFSVYLHDTSSKGTFGHEERGVSHGCIRLERPLDLAFFLMGYPKEEKMDRIRLSVDREPVTEAGKKMKEDGQYKRLRFYGFKAVPLFIDYRTVYLAADANHSLVYCNDHYGYDKPLNKALKHLKF